MVDYLAVEAVDSEALAALGVGLKRGAELAGIEIPGGELAVLPELLRGHPSPGGFELSGTAIGTVALERIITGTGCADGDVLIGLPSSGLHSNGYTLARALAEDHHAERPPALGGATIGEALLEPTVIYAKAIAALLAQRRCGPRARPHHRRRRPQPQAPERRGRLRDRRAACRFLRSAPGCARPARSRAAQAYQVFNMGCGFVVVVPAAGGSGCGRDARRAPPRGARDRARRRRTRDGGAARAPRDALVDFTQR